MNTTLRTANTRIVPGILKTGATVGLMSIVAGWAATAYGQIGYSTELVVSVGGLSHAEFAEKDDFDKAMGTRSIQFPGVRLVIRGDRVVAIRAKSNNLRFLMATCKYLVGGKPRRPVWQLAPQFIYVYRPVGS